MSRKTMIALAKAVALTSGLTVDAFAHGRGGEHGGGFGGRGHMGGCGGARIDSGFVSGFAGLHFGTALGLALFGLVLASVAGEAASDDEQGRKACMYDALTVCAKFIPDREQIANCLMVNREHISQTCRLLLARAH
jgi:hypothetical protein